MIEQPFVALLERFYRLAGNPEYANPPVGETAYPAYYRTAPCLATESSFVSTSGSTVVEGAHNWGVNSYYNTYATNNRSAWPQNRLRLISFHPDDRKPESANGGCGPWYDALIHQTNTNCLDSNAFQRNTLGDYHRQLSFCNP